jgi:hypothetical protein
VILSNFWQGIQPIRMIQPIQARASVAIQQPEGNSQRGAAWDCA